MKKELEEREDSDRFEDNPEGGTGGTTVSTPNTPEQSRRCCCCQEEQYHARSTTTNAHSTPNGGTFDLGQVSR